MKKSIYLFALLFSASFIFTACDNDEPPADDPIILVTDVTLDRSTMELALGEQRLLRATVLPANADNQNVTWTVHNTAVATISSDYREFVLVRAITTGTTTIIVTTECGEKTATSIVTVLPDISAPLDGVLIDGVRWATRNVDMPGTFAEYPESFGMLYQWNRRTGWATTGFVVDWNFIGAIGTSWARINDPCPEGWRVPTEEELTNLGNTNNVLVTRNGVNGTLFGTTPYQIFLPTAGFRRYNGVSAGANQVGYYWSSAPRGWYARGLRIQRDWSTVSMGNYDRAVGMSIRCVAE